MKALLDYPVPHAYYVFVTSRLPSHPVMLRLGGGRHAKSYWRMGPP